MRPLFLACLCLSLTAFAAPDPTPHPTKSSPKGLQVQMIPDALELGIHHANLNLKLNALLSPEKEAKPGQLTASADGFTFVLNQNYVGSLDRQIKPLSDKGVVVSLIVTTSRSPNERIRKLTIHPKADPIKGITMASDTVTPEGRACYKALTEFIARRWSSADAKYGRVWGWIVSNEVNSHHEWHQMGPATAEEVVTQYEDQVRLAWESLRQHSAHARVYISMEHHWTAKGHKDPFQACPGRTLLELCAKRARERGEVASPKAFLFSIARNLALDRFRHREVLPTEPLAENEELAVLDEGDHIPDLIAHNQELALLTEAIQSLPDRCRQIFTLRKVYGLSQAEIAAQLGVSENTISAQLTIGVKKCMAFMLQCRREREGRWP